MINKAAVSGAGMVALPAGTAAASAGGIYLRDQRDDGISQSLAVLEVSFVLSSRRC
jgi:hypothetical protein